MKSDNIKRYVELRASLLREKQDLEQRLLEINSALGSERPAAAPAETAAPEAPARKAARAGRRGRRGGLSLRAAVLQLTSQQALTKDEILQGLKRLGYKFTTKDPKNSLGVILYGKNPKFRNQDGRFSPLDGAAAAASVVKTKRVISPEGRERIAAAQRARWAKAKGK